MNKFNWVGIFVGAVAVAFTGTINEGWSAERPDAPALHYYHPVAPGPSKQINFDVAVYGGTPAGVAAAVQAGRMGKDTVLLSTNGFVGGLTSGGLTATDVGNGASIGGLAQEYYTRIGQLRDLNPSEAEALFVKMLEEAGVTVLFDRWLESVVMDGEKIVSATMETAETVAASVFIDATYEGDLLAAANVSHYVGREPAGTYGESLGGQMQNVSWSNVYQFCNLPVSPYVEPDNPDSGLLPEISAEPLGEKGDGDFRVQAYNFRMRLSNAADKLPFPKPNGYDSGRYALLARFMNFDPEIHWTLDYTTTPMTDGPVQMRVGDSNNAGSFSSDYVGGSNLWPDGTFDATSFSELPPPRRGLTMPFRELYKIRERVFQDHVTYQQGLMYFLANDPQVPKSLQERVNHFGIDPHEFKETGGWPHQLYVREGRRMVSDYVMTQDDAQSKRKVSDSVGLASYQMDSHFCHRMVVELDGKMTVRNEGGFGHGCPRPYPVSYRSIVPRKEECTNLLVPLCLSASHVAYGSIRMEPVFMILGQSAGTAAAMAIDAGIAVQDLAYNQLEKKLLEDGQILSFLPADIFAIANLEGVVVDDETAVSQGDWTQSASRPPYVEDGYRHDSNGNKGISTMDFTAELPRPGRYEVRMAYSRESNRAEQVPVAVYHRGGVEKLTINQRRKPEIKDCWTSLGEFDFDKEGRVVLSNAGTKGFVIADAVQFLPVEDGGTPVP